MNRKTALLVIEPAGNMAKLLPNQSIKPSVFIVIAKNRLAALGWQSSLAFQGHAAETSFTL